MSNPNKENRHTVWGSSVVFFCHKVGLMPTATLLLLQKETTAIRRSFLLEQDTGVEPAFTAWEAVVLPIYESCGCEGIITKLPGKFNTFLSKVGRCAENVHFFLWFFGRFFPAWM